MDSLFLYSIFYLIHNRFVCFLGYCFCCVFKKIPTQNNENLLAHISQVFMTTFHMRDTPDLSVEDDLLNFNTYHYFSSVRSLTNAFLLKVV